MTEAAELTPREKRLVYAIKDSEISDKPIPVPKWLYDQYKALLTKSAAKAWYRDRERRRLKQEKPDD